MVNALVIATFVACFFVDYLARKLQVISPYFVLLPELFAGLAILVIVGRLIGGKRLQMDGRYFLFLGLLAFTIALGAVAQGVPSGAVVSGLRDYVPFLPFLLLPAIYTFSARQIKTQLILLAVMLAVQVPLAAYQRFFSYAHKMHTGDVVTGTLTTSAALSILMVAGVTVLTVLYLKRRLSMPVLLVATGFLLAPTMLNETKATVIMLPIAMLVPLFLMQRSERPMRRLFPLLAVGVLVGGVFVNVYNVLIENRESGSSLQEFFLEGGVGNYVYKGSLEGDERVGRVDSVQLALRGISDTPLNLAFGLGAGNVSPAQLPGFGGRYAHYYDLYKVSFTQISMLLWNLGFMGLVVFGLFFVAAFRDALFLARADSSRSALGQIWAPLVLIACMCFFYKSILTVKEVIFPFMFYAGVAAQNAYVLRQEQRVRRREARGTVGRWQPASALARQ